MGKERGPVRSSQETTQQGALGRGRTAEKRKTIKKIEVYLHSGGLVPGRGLGEGVSKRVV